MKLKTPVRALMLALLCAVAVIEMSGADQLVDVDPV